MRLACIKQCAVLRELRSVTPCSATGEAAVRSAEERVVRECHLFGGSCNCPVGDCGVAPALMRRKAADVAALIAQADEAARSGGAGIDVTEQVLRGDGDWMPGMPRPTGPVPAEPAGEFTQEMHTRDRID